MTKKYFGTDGIRGAVNSKNINGDMFFKFGLASGTFFRSQKKNSTDEFLVEKKSPLVMPPEYGELPIPKIDENEDNIESKDSSNKIEKLII